MGVNTKGILGKRATVENIQIALEKFGCKNVKIDRFNNISSVYIDYEFMYDGEYESRRLYYIPNTDVQEYYGEDVISELFGNYVSLARYGSSIEIIKYLCETFGGYLDEDDCDDEWFVPINENKFMEELQGVEKFKHELWLLVGSKANMVHDLFKKYKDLL